MSRYFTHYWKNSTWFRSQEWHADDDLLTYVAGNLFTQRGLMVGDNLYVVTVLSGQLYLCGKMMVGKICNMHDAAKALGRAAEDLWEASEYVIASEATPMRFDLGVPLMVTAGLRFVNKKRSVPLDFIVPGQLDQQTLRGVRELEPSSALELDDLLPSMRLVNFTPPSRPRICINCGSERIASILYGMPAFSDELQRDLDLGTVVLGGCVVGEKDPIWQCADCGTSF